MRDPLCEAMRSALRAVLPVRAFLRRDRGDALYVTDAPRLDPSAGWPERFAEIGFSCQVRQDLAHLSPNEIWMDRLAARFTEPPDPLSASLRRFDGPPDEASLALFAIGLRTLDGGPYDAACDRRLRQRAAVCLRTRRASPDGAGPSAPGGGLYACALARYLIEKERAT